MTHTGSALDALSSTAKELLASFCRGMLAAAVGPVMASRLLELGIEPLVQKPFRMGAILKQLTDALAGVDSDDDGRY